MRYSTLATELPIMTTIRTTCTTCGDVELTTADVGLELSPGAQEGRYRFDCPFCGTTQRRPATQRVVSVLLATGVGYDIVATVSAITEDEISGFTRDLDGQGWFQELASSDS
jgi:hypothetical protein